MDKWECNAECESFYVTKCCGHFSVHSFVLLFTLSLFIVNYELCWSLVEKSRVLGNFTPNRLL